MTVPRILLDQPLGQLLTMPEAVSLMRSCVEAAASGRLHAPPRIHVPLGPRRLTFTAGGRSGGAEGVVGFRVYHSETPADDDSSQVTVVYRPDGRLSGVVVGSELGEWRTGALGGVAIDLLAPSHVARLGVLGAGRQAKTQVLAALAVRGFEQVKVFSRDAAGRESFAEAMSERANCPVVACRSAEEVVSGADVLVCATSSRRPVFDARWLKDAVHINNVGPKEVGGAELPVNVYATAEVLATDSLAQLRQLGDEFVCHAALRRRTIIELADLIRAPLLSPPRRSVFISQGLAGTEVLLAAELLRRCSGDGNCTT